jgi:hypothetical protein
MQFPWMVYSKDADQGSILPLPRGQSVRCKAVADEADLAAAVKDGWYPTVPEALAGKLDAPPVEAKPTNPEKPPEDVAAEAEAEPEPEADEPARPRPRKPRQ